ncbi:MAG: type I polyketide synthase, partial [Gemmataceae bacterium]
MASIQPAGSPGERSRLEKAVIAIDKLQSKLDALEGARTEPIAIVGMSCRFPGAPSLDAFWDLLHGGREALRDIPVERWDMQTYYDANPDAPGKIYVRRGGFLDDIDQFDPAFFGISPREAVSLDPQQRLLLETTWEALEHAGLPAEDLAGSRTGVFIGICGSDYSFRLLERGESAIDAYLGTGVSPAVATGRLSSFLGLQGPSLAIDTACSSSLVSIHQACLSLRSRESDLALAGGVNLLLWPVTTINFCKAKILSDRCKAFDAAADGFARSEGCAMVVLKRLGDARRDGDRVLALIRGSAVNQDGRSGGLTVPSGLSQQAVMRDALANGAVSPLEVEYVEAHGTGTSLGDPIEVQAVAAALGNGRPASSPLLIGSVKTNIGHLEGAAGIAGLVKVVLALQHEEIPRHLHFTTPNPHIPWESLPIRVVTESTPWPRHARRRLAGVSSFGFSGTNAHVVLEEAPLPETAVAALERPLHLLVLSARTEPALKEQAARYAAVLASTAESLPDVCYTAAAGRSHFEHRLAVSGDSSEQIRRQLVSVGTAKRDGVHQGHQGRASRQRPRVAWLFTGQGSQYLGMGRTLFDTQPMFRKTMQHCEELLRPYLPRPVSEVLFLDGELLQRT